MDVLDYGRFVLSRFRSVYFSFGLNEIMLSDPFLSQTMGCREMRLDFRKFSYAGDHISEANIDIPGLVMGTMKKEDGPTSW